MDTKRSVVRRFAQNLGVDDEKLLQTLKSTCFKQKEKVNITHEQMMALLIVAEQHHLNPFTKEIYAYSDSKNGIVPVVGVDGWSRIINDKPTFDGMTFNMADNNVSMPDAKECPEWIECVIYDSSRAHPVAVREYLDEVYRPPFKKKDGGDYTISGPWQTHTKRMLRHKAMIQCARIAYGFGGIYDQDEAERIIEAEVIPESKHRFAPGEKDDYYQQVMTCLESNDENGVKEIFNELEKGSTEYQKVYFLFDAPTRNILKEIGV